TWNSSLPRAALRRVCCMGWSKLRSCCSNISPQIRTMKTNCRINRYLFSLSLLSCCIAALPARADVGVMNRVLQQTPALSGFAICHGGGCARVTTAAIAPDAWGELQAICQPALPDAEAERTCIAEMLAGF